MTLRTLKKILVNMYEIYLLPSKDFLPTVIPAEGMAGMARTYKTIIH